MNKINPTGLKGYEVSDRMKELMGITSMAENKKPSTVELTKLGPDGKVYAIVRENHEYYIKTANNKSNLIAEDFGYIGGLQNKKNWAYPSYEKATKHLNLKFISLQEAYDVKGTINILKDEKLIKEDGDAFMISPKKLTMFQEGSMSECCGAPMKEGKCSQCGGSLNEDQVAEVEDNDGEGIPTNGVGKAGDSNTPEPDTDVLDEVQQAVEDMTESKRPAKTLLPKKKLSIETSMNEMDEIIDNMGKKKVQPKK